MVTFDQGANNGNIITTVIDVLDDPLIEGTETFTISGSVDPPASFVPGRDTANVTILDNDGKFALHTKHMIVYVATTSTLTVTNVWICLCAIYFIVTFIAM